VDSEYLFELWIVGSGRCTNSLIQNFYGFNNSECGKKMWILYSIKLSDCIVWNATYESWKQKKNEAINLNQKNYLPFFSEQGTIKRNHPTTTKFP